MLFLSGVFFSRVVLKKTGQNQSLRGSTLLLDVLWRKSSKLLHLFTVSNYLSIILCLPFYVCELLLVSLKKLWRSCIGFGQWKCDFGRSYSNGHNSQVQCNKGDLVMGWCSFCIAKYQAETMRYPLLLHFLHLYNAFSVDLKTFMTRQIR